MELEPKVKNIIERSIAEFNSQVDAFSQLDTAPDTPLLDDETALDSLALVSLVVIIQDRIREEFGQSVALIDEEAMDNPQGAFRNVGTLGHHVAALLSDSGIN